MREQAAMSIENIMFDMVANWDGPGQACTTVECMLAASVEASRVYIMNEQFNQATHPDAAMHDDYGHHPTDAAVTEAYPEEGYYDEVYPEGDYVGGPGTYPDENGNFDVDPAAVAAMEAAVNDPGSGVNVTRGRRL